MLANGYSKAQIRALEVNIFIQFSNLQDRWWRKPMPTIRAVSYELQQKFTCINPYTIFTIGLYSNFYLTQDIIHYLNFKFCDIPLK